MKKIAFVLACILTISICLAGCQETEFDTGEGTPVFSLDANEISAVTFQNGNTGEKTIVSNRDEITEIADYLNAFRYTETQSVRGGDGWSSRIIIDFNEGESISFYSLEAGKIIMDDTEYILTSSEEGKVFDLEYNDEEPNTVKAKLFCPEIAGLFCRIAGLFCHDSRANLSLKPVCFGIAIS